MARCACLLLAALAVLGGVGLSDAGIRRAIDWSRLSSGGQRLVEPVVTTAQISRDVPHIRYPSRREIWEYLLDYPDFASDVARALREGKYRIRRVADHYDVDDGRGVTGIMRALLAEDGRRIFYLEGRYDTPWLPTLKGRAVLVLDSEYLEPAGGPPLADVRVMGYVRIDNLLVRALVAIVKDFSERSFDGKVRKFFGHVERLSRRACDDPQGLLDFLAGQPGLDRERLAEFRQLLLRLPLPRTAELG
jgi:hypothetical protein